jgi:protein ImuB
MARLRIHAKLAIAPTPGAAWALTYADQPLPIITSPVDLTNAIALLHPVALRLPDDTLALLHHLGLQTIAHILRLPRDSLPARFGHELLLRIDQALGHTAEPLTPLAWHEPIQASIDFDGVVDSLEALWQAFGELIERIVKQLTSFGAGARRINVTFVRPYVQPIERTIELSAASRNAANLFNLIRCTMETIGQARKQRGRKSQRFQLRDSRVNEFAPSGFIGLRLSVPVFERLSEEQIDLLEQDEHVGRHELARLIEQLRIRLGEEALVGVEAVECYVPELAYKLQPKSIGNSSALSTQDSGLPTRPLHLFPTPHEIPVIVRPSHDRDGAPISFTLNNQTHPILHAVGPERIAGVWWNGHHKTRDYFDVEDQHGRRWWVFRVFQTSRWFLHGIFE